MFKILKSKEFIIAAIFGIPAVSIQICQWLEIKPSKGMLNYMLQIVYFKVPLIWVLFLISIFYLIWKHLFKTSKKAIIQPEKQTNDIVKLISNEIDVDIRSTGEQIRFYKTGAGSVTVRIWLKVTNKSTSEIILDKIKCNLWLDQLVKEGESSLSISIKPKETKNDVLFSMNLSDSEIEYLSKFKKEDSIVPSLKVIAFFNINKEVGKKEFDFRSINYSIDENILARHSRIELTDEHYGILLSLLSESDHTYFRDSLQNIYIKKYNKNIIDFNILKKELLTENLIKEYTTIDGAVWKLTDDGFNIASKKYKEITKKPQ